MFRVLAVCALALVVEGSSVGLIANSSRDLVDPMPYARDVRDVDSALNVLDKFVRVDKVYSVFEPDVHVLAVLGVVLHTAQSLSGCLHWKPEEVYRQNLENEVANVYLNPSDLVQELLKLRRLVEDQLNPIITLVRRMCNNLSDKECDSAVQKVVIKDKKLLKSATLLNEMEDVAKLLVSNEGRLMEIATTLDVLPYLMNNESEMLKHVELLVPLLQLLNRRPRC